MTLRTASEARCMGCGEQLPVKARPSRARKFCSQTCRKRTLYGGICASCGAPTHGDGLVSVARHCLRCARAQAHANRRWTPETVIAALHRSAQETGESPSATRWLRGDRPDYAPSVGVVQREFGSWSAALEAAGLPQRPAGRPGWTRQTGGRC
jgi:hypothetical protein